MVMVCLCGCVARVGMWVNVGLGRDVYVRMYVCFCVCALVCVRVTDSMGASACVCV